MSHDVLALAQAIKEPRPFPPETPVTLFVCSTCRRVGEAENGPRAGTILHAALRAVVADVEGVVVRSVKCLASCSRAPAIAMSRPGSWSYIFGNIDPGQDAPALVEGALLMRRSTDGLLPWRGRPDCLKRNLVGRLPPPDFSEEAGP